MRGPLNRRPLKIPDKKQLPASPPAHGQFSKMTIWRNGPSPWGIWVFKGCFEVKVRSGSGSWDPQFECLRIEIMRTDRALQLPAWPPCRGSLRPFPYFPLPARLPARLPACPPASSPACSPARPPASLPPRLPAYLPEHLSTATVWAPARPARSPSDGRPCAPPVCIVYIYI